MPRNPSDPDSIYLIWPFDLRALNENKIQNRDEYHVSRSRMTPSHWQERIERRASQRTV